MKARRSTRRRGREGLGPAGTMAVGLLLALQVLGLLLAAEEFKLEGMKLAVLLAALLAAFMLLCGRIRTRFSLRSLIIFQMLAGSAVAMSVHRDPWELRHVLRGHTDFLVGATFSPDGTRVLTAGADCTARTWDASTGEDLCVLAGHAGWLSGARYSPDGMRILTVGEDGTARVWSAAGGKPLEAVEGYRTAVFSPDGERLLTPARERPGRALVWECRSGRLLFAMEAGADAVDSAVYSPEGLLIVTVGVDGSVRAWTGEGAPRCSLRGHTGTVECAAFSPDGRLVVTAGRDMTARIWDASDGAWMLTLKGHAGWVVRAGFSPDSRRVVTASWDDTARIWDSGSGACVATLAGHKSTVNSAEFSPDGLRVVTASNDGAARVWDSGSGRCLAVLAEHSDGVVSASFSPDGRSVVTASLDGTAAVWRRRRPEGRLGYALMPEAWFSVFFLGALVWSLGRDRETLSDAALMAEAKRTSRGKEPGRSGGSRGGGGFHDW